MLLRRFPLSLLKYLWIFFAIFIIVVVGVFTYASTGNTIDSHFSAVPVGVAVRFRKDFYSAVLNREVHVPQAEEEANHSKRQTDSG